MELRMVTASHWSPNRCSARSWSSREATDHLAPMIMTKNPATNMPANQTEGAHMMGTRLIRMPAMLKA
eukprot:scaffold13189_cov103-Isochrysis_galbana.AAC.1